MQAAEHISLKFFFFFFETIMNQKIFFLFSVKVAIEFQKKKFF